MQELEIVCDRPALSERIALIPFPNLIRYDIRWGFPLAPKHVGITVPLMAPQLVSVRHDSITLPRLNELLHNVQLHPRLLDVHCSFHSLGFGELFTRLPEPEYFPGMLSRPFVRLFLYRVDPVAIVTLRDGKVQVQMCKSWAPGDVDLF